MSQFLKAQPNKHESLIVDKFTRVSVVQTSYVDHKQPFFFLRNWGVEVWWGEGGSGGGGADRERFKGREGEGWICVSIKFSLKPNLHPDVQMVFESPKSEVKRNVQKFHSLTEGRQEKAILKKTRQLYSDPESEGLTSIPFTFPKDICRFFTPQLSGCSPPLSPPASSPPRTSRSPSHPSSSFLACAEGMIVTVSWQEIFEKKHYKWTSRVPIRIIKFGWK